MKMNEELVRALHEEASDRGIYLPLKEDVGVLSEAAVLHGLLLPNREVLHVPPAADADENGAPTEATIARYCTAVQHSAYGMLWTEPMAVTPDARTNPHQLVLCEENQSMFTRLCTAMHDAAMASAGMAPVVIALLDHAGRHALKPLTIQHSPTLPTPARVVPDIELTLLAVSCGTAARAAEHAGFSGVAINACERNLFGESLAAFHREGKFGGDFDNRTRFIRDCFTAIKSYAPDAIPSIRLCLSDGIPKPNGWGMSFSAPGTPDLSEPTALLNILRKLFGLELVACEVGIPHINWMTEPLPEPEMIRVSRLCTCISMLDSDLQENVKIIFPELALKEIPFENLAAGMIEGEFATFAGYTFAGYDD